MANDPIHQFRLMPGPILRQQNERGAAGDQRGINAQFLRALITAVFEAIHLPLLHIRQTDAGVLEILAWL